MTLEHPAPRRAKPPQPRGALPRPRLLSLLRGPERIVACVAPAGYGKTTTFAAHLGDFGLACWYTLDAEDADPSVFAVGLARALSRLPNAERLERALEDGASPRALARIAADVLEANGALLVLDEAQHLTHPLVEDVAREVLLVARVALLSRTSLVTPTLTTLGAQGDVLHLGTAELSFDRAEMSALLALMDAKVTPDEAQLAWSVTEGWPIAARFLAQVLASGRLSPSALRNFETQSTQLGTLFAYLAQEVLGPLQEPLRDFLRRSSVFETLTPDLLQRVLNEPRAATYLDALARSGTFLTREGGGFRAHPLLRAHLRAALSPEEARELARLGAAHFEDSGSHRLALHAHLQAGDVERAAALLAAHASRWLGQGRVALVERALRHLPEETMRANPELYEVLGDVHRARSRYAAATSAYDRAPRAARALGGARVYLDTVRPALAEPLLHEAQELGATEPDVLARLRAENDLNAGRLASARRRWPDITETARFALRRGHLQEAIERARSGARDELGGQREARGHREALLLESLVGALLGELEEAERSARSGALEGERLESPFVRSLALSRLGHVHLARGSWTEAGAAYEEALAFADGTAAPRLTAEPLMGLAFLAAAKGAPHARDLAERALAISEESGDRYMTALVRLTFALGLAHARHEDAARELRRASADFAACGDTFGVHAAALASFAVDGSDSSAAREAALARPFLLTRSTLLSVARTRVARAALLARLGSALTDERRADLSGIARELGYADVPAQHPGAEVRVRVLGRLVLERGGVEVRDWGRAKARDLLALLVAHEGGLAREAAQEALFPDVEPSVSERNMRIVLHALGQLLEPSEPHGYFLERGEWLRLKPSPDLVVDAWDAWRVLNAAPGSAGRAAALLALPERYAACDLDDVQAQAERYATRLPEALTTEAAAAFDRGAFEDAARLAERALLAEPAHEPSLRVLLRTWYALGNAHGAVRAYQGCERALATLGLTPLPETRALFRTLVGATSP
ncbi:BTAD domain-containing putative transcriptional regulator [Deinococcus yavapaiensis]|uniref:Transcriptional regulator n=1 Tax=Deinococcus yavapaiensis KR-236 TaxID=694435 RepID=A0A318S3R4_9DEIO|nr:BTAD domain-containing putative transcriptional regulator [Deinococcus yavapaiensis]PYE49405.1 transcriptional regulator [Deinococcus yavapaiensis KR-236]